MATAEDTSEGHEPDRQPLTRRQAIGLGTAVGVGAWIAPSLLSVDAASAQTDQPQAPLLGSIAGTIVFCGGQQWGDLNISATPSGGGTTVSTIAFAQAGNYLLSGLPSGTYDLTFVVTGFQPQTENGIVVTAPATTTFNIDYTQVC